MGKVLIYCQAYDPSLPIPSDPYPWVILNHVWLFRKSRDYVLSEHAITQNAMQSEEKDTARKYVLVYLIHFTEIC